jgi:hypothetical protein
MFRLDQRVVSMKVKRMAYRYEAHLFKGADEELGL